MEFLRRASATLAVAIEFQNAANRNAPIAVPTDRADPRTRIVTPSTSNRHPGGGDRQKTQSSYEIHFCYRWRGEFVGQGPDGGGTGGDIR